MSKELYEWIKASERLPERDKMVITKSSVDVIARIYYKDLGEFYPSQLDKYDPEKRIDNVYEWLSPVSTDWGKLEKELIKDAGTETLHKVDGFKVFHWIKQHLVTSVRQDSNVPCVAQVDGSNSIEQITPELYEALDALCDMWSQYCDGEAGHMFMSAGENAADVLDKYKLLKNDKGTGGEVDYDQLKKLKALLTSPASNMTDKQLKENAKQFAAFITDVAEAMKKHNVDDMLCVFGMNDEIRNTYIPLSEKGELELYCKLSDGIHEWLQMVGHKKSGNSKHTGKLSLKK